MIYFPFSIRWWWFVTIVPLLASGTVLWEDNIINNFACFIRNDENSSEERGKPTFLPSSIAADQNVDYLITGCAMVLMHLPSCSLKAILCFSNCRITYCIHVQTVDISRNRRREIEKRKQVLEARMATTSTLVGKHSSTVDSKCFRWTKSRKWYGQGSGTI